MILDSPIISGSSTVTGDLTVLGTLTASVSGSVTSASYATNAETLDGLDSTSFTTTSSFTAYTASTNASILSIAQNIAILYVSSSVLDSRVTITEATASSLTIASSSFSTRVSASEASISNLTTASSSFSTRTTNLETASGSFSTRVTSNESNISSLQTASGSFSTRTTNLETASGSFSTRTTNLETASGSFSTRVTNAESSITSLNSRSGSFATTGSNRFIGNQTITGSLFITENLTVLGSSSISYVSQSTLNIGTNLITVNAQNPSIRFGGLAVIDSGSAPQVSGSWLFDSIQNRWIMIHQQTAGGALTSSIALMGPETYNNLGSETQITQNRLVKGVAGASGEHIGDSNISDTGTVVSINSATQITGSLGVTGAITFANTISATQYTAQSDTAYYRVRRAAGTDVGYIADSGTWGDSGTDFSIGASSTNLRFYTNNSVTERMRLDSAGRLGIGTTSVTSGYRMEVVGDILLSTTSGNRSLVLTTTNANAALNTIAGTGLELATDGSNRNLAFRTGATTAMYINSSANVGIGTTSPTNSRLLIAGTHVSGNSILGVVPIGNQVATIGLYNSSGTRRGLFYSDTGFVRVESDTDPIQIYAGGVNGLNITTGGNVSIGTTNPQSQLHIYNSGGTATLRLHGTRNSDGSVGILNFSNITDITGGYIIGSIGVDRSGFDNGGAMIFSTATAASTPTERMRITSGGVVQIGQGVGNDAATRYLQIQGSGTNAAVLELINYWNGTAYTAGVYGGKGSNAAATLLFKVAFFNGSAAQQRDAMFINESGNVGIGTTNPLSPLHIQAAEPTLRIVDSNDSGVLFIGNTGGFSYIRPFSRDFRFLNAAGSSMAIITSGGNVGIGLTNPSYKLHVVGSTDIINATSTTTNARINIGHSGNGGYVGYANIGAGDAANTFYVTNGSGVIGNGITMNNAGAVTISSSVTTTLLDISGNSLTPVSVSDRLAIGSASSYRWIQSFGSTPLSINPLGNNVGIGTASPTDKLHIFSSATTGEIRLGGGNGSGNARMYFQAHPSTAYIDMYGNSQYLPLQINANPLLFNGGNVGIGTTSPGDRLEVIGDIKQATTTSVGGKYARKVIHTGSNFDNPTVNLYVAGTDTNAVNLIKVTVFQTLFGSEAGNIHVGYARIIGQNASGQVTTMTVEHNGGTANVGTLSWSGHTLRYTCNRASNYDGYEIIVEISGQLALSSW